jgi:WD40 repeat protein
MKARILCIAMLTLLCASCGGSSGGPSSTPAHSTTVQVPGLMKAGRFAPAVTLKSGIVLEVGGLGSLAGVNLASAEIYQPRTGTFTLVANQLPIAAQYLCLAALSDGTALEVGGHDSSANALSQAEIYDPARNRFVPTKVAMNEARYGCTATTLQDGTVLIAGGNDSSGNGLDTAELYNPASGTFSYTNGDMISQRAFHAAVLLADGKVLLAGGLPGSMLPALASAELYDPASGTFSATAGPLNSARRDFAAILLADGRALLAGGASSSALDSAELYDPASSTFSFTANNMSTGRWAPSAAPLPDGNAIVGAGSGSFPALVPDASCDLFDASSNTFSPTGALHIARAYAAAVVLPDGAPLILGGIDNQGLNTGNYQPSGEIYSPTTGTFTVTGGLNALRIADASALLPDGRVLIAGGYDENTALDTAEVFDPTTRHFTPTANNLDVPRSSFNAVTLNDGKVLIANGSAGVTAELFDPKTTSFSATSGPMIASRLVATATLLGDGTVLIAGGLDTSGNALDTAELYNPGTGTFTATGTMTSPRAIHTATLLANGEVLLAGGSTSVFYPDALDTAEIYDPNTAMFTAAPNTMTSARVSATANLLANGQVLIAGGVIANASSVATAELFDPKTGTFTPTAGVMSNARAFHSSVYLPDGRVMIAGGGLVTSGYSISTATVDFYDPSTGQFHAGVPMLSPRDFFTATLLDSGKVLIPGGIIENALGIAAAALETAEVYTP